MVTKNRAYWENKHPLAEQMYEGRPLPNGKRYNMDVRHFVWADDIFLKKIIDEMRRPHPEAEGQADLVRACQKFVCNTLTYTSDTTLGASEYWLFPAETLVMKRGDCEDGSILMASLISCALPPDELWRIRVVAGWVEAEDGQLGGHAYCTYCRPDDNEWVILDWCYFADPQIPIDQKPLAKDIKQYRDIWFSFNSEKAWSHKDLAMTGRIKRIVEII